MKIVIVNSKQWFSLLNSIKNNNEILFISDKEKLNYQTLDKFDPDIIFFIHWNWIVPTEIHEKFLCIVFHLAPLPYGRGGSPIQNLILRKFKNAPICALRMTEELDAGPIYLKKNISLDGKLSEIFARMNLILNEMMDILITELPTPKKQTGQKYVFKRLGNEDNKLPQNLTLESLFDRIRMLDDKDYPNSFIEYGNLKIEFSDASFEKNELICKAKINIKKIESN